MFCLVMGSALAATEQLPGSEMSAEANPVDTATIEADRVVKRQKVCSTKFASAVDRLLAAVNDSRVRLQAGSGDDVMTELNQHVTQLGVSSELHEQTKQLHGAIAKLGKVNDGAIKTGYVHSRQVDMSAQHACRLLIKHLCQTYARPLDQLNLIRTH